MCGLERGGQSYGSTNCSHSGCREQCVESSVGHCVLLSLDVSPYEYCLICVNSQDIPPSKFGLEMVKTVSVVGNVLIVSATVLR